MRKIMAAVCAGAICVVSASVVIGREPLAQEPMAQGGMGVQVLPDGAQPTPAAAATGLPAGVTHGNYCGADWANGEWKNDSTKNGVCKIGATLTLPTDETDALCMAHDKAYCTTDPAAKDLADQQFIGDLQKQKTSLQAQWTANGCDKPAPAVQPATDNSEKSCYDPNVADKSCYKGSGVRETPPASTEKKGGGGGSAATSTKPAVTAVPVVSAICLQLASEIAYSDAAITAYTVKREQYQEDLAEKEAQERLGKTIKTQPSGGDVPGGRGMVAPFRW
jgi:hypothetical protein